MFKKSLLAAALVGSAFGANAQLSVTTSATTTDKAYDVSSQGLPLTKAHTLADVVVTLNAADLSAITAGSKVQLSFTGAFVSTAPGAPTYTDTGTDTTTDGVLGVPAITSTTATATFTTIPAGGTIAGDTVTFANVPLLLASSDVGSTVSVTASILTSSDVVVSSTTSTLTKVIDVVDQFATAVTTKADAKIDVANERKTFESKAKTDTIVLTGTTTGTGATAVSAKVTVKGDFSDDISKLSDGTNTYVVNGTNTAAEFTYTTGTSPTVAAFLSGATTLTATVDGVDAIEPRSFTASVDLSYTDAESAARTQALLTDSSAGAWVLNGDGSAHVSFMPFGSAYSQSVTVQNNGAVEGEVTIDWYTATGKVSTVLATKAAPYVVTDISSELRTVAAANGISGNVAFDVIVNSPDGQINVVAVYYNKADGDRVLVLGEAIK